MRKALKAIQARVIYLIFGMALTMFVCVLLKSDDEFKFGHGEILSKEQRIAARFAAFVVVAVAGYISYKTAKADWKLWKKNRRDVISDRQ